MNVSPNKVLMTGVAVVATLLLAAGTAAGDEHDHEEIPLHPHALVIGVGGDEDTGLTAVSCVELAANQSLRLNAHHAHIHTGAAGEALNEHTGNFAIPLAPLTPWANCDELFEAFDVTIVRGNSARSR